MRWRRRKRKGRRREIRETGGWGGGGRGTAHREAINLSLQVSPGTDLPPSSYRSLLTGFSSLEAVEMSVSAPCWSLKEACLSFLFHGPLHNTAAGFTGAIQRERERERSHNLQFNHGRDIPRLLFLRSQSLSPAHTQHKGIKQRCD